MKLSVTTTGTPAEVKETIKAQSLPAEIEAFVIAGVERLEKLGKKLISVFVSGTHHKDDDSHNLSVSATVTTAEPAAKSEPEQGDNGDGETAQTKPVDEKPAAG